ncbi:MAG: CsbD family protein [Gaiellaceae bacterium]
MSNWDKVEGEAKEKVGELTDDESLEKEGKAQGALGDVKEKADEAKEKVEKAADEVEDEIRDKL